jgi:hypothetical protein
MRRFSGPPPPLQPISGEGEVGPSRGHVLTQTRYTLCAHCIRHPAAEWPKIWSVLAVPSLQLIQKF